MVNIFSTQIPISRSDYKGLSVTSHTFIQSSKRKASGNTDKKISTGTLNAIFENLMQVSVVGLIIPWDKNLNLSGRWKEDIGGIQGPSSKYLLNNIWLAIDESLLTHPPLFCNQQLEQQREIFEYKYPIDKGMDHSAQTPGSSQSSLFKRF